MFYCGEETVYFMPLFYLMDQLILTIIMEIVEINI